MYKHLFITSNFTIPELFENVLGGKTIDPIVHRFNVIDTTEIGWEDKILNKIKDYKEFD